MNIIFVCKHLQVLTNYYQVFSSPQVAFVCIRWHEMTFLNDEPYGFKNFINFNSKNYRVFRLTFKSQFCFFTKDSVQAAACQLFTSFYHWRFQAVVVAVVSIMLNGFVAFDLVQEKYVDRLRAEAARQIVAAQTESHWNYISRVEQTSPELFQRSPFQIEQTNEHAFLWSRCYQAPVVAHGEAGDWTVIGFCVSENFKLHVGWCGKAFHDVQPVFAARFGKSDINWV